VPIRGDLPNPRNLSKSFNGKLGAGRYAAMSALRSGRLGSFFFACSGEGLLQRLLLLDHLVLLLLLDLALYLLDTSKTYLLSQTLLLLFLL
jgi:hypothetical protein